MANIKQIKHLTARAGFGMRYEDAKSAGNTSVKSAVKALFKTSENIEPLTVVKESLDYMMMAKGDVEARKMFMQQQRQQERDLNMEWINRMSITNAVLREKMTLFWNNHFACRSNNAFFAQQLNNIHRTHALGNFRTMLLEVSRSPAMLQFLNNQQNVKNHPNENFGRELMELFTIGRGNYTEDDVKNAARAFTGWGFNRTGEYVLRPAVHDNDQKVFFGKTGNFNGEDVINALLEKKQTAYFISNKLYKYLVNEVPDTAHVTAMADVFYKSGYEIKPLLEFVFNAPWFYDDKNTGNLIKSPVELIVGLNRQFAINYDQPEILFQFQRTLGQVLFNPPNVAGWPGGRNWIDSSSLMYRIKIPSTILNGGLIDFTGKADPEDEAYLASQRKQQLNVIRRVQTQPDWNRFLQAVPANASKLNIAEFMLEPKIGASLSAAINNAKDTKAVVIEVVSSPEYQLC